MSDQILMLKPIFKERIWGGTKLNSHFGYEIPSIHTGECWAISSHKEGSSVVDSGTYKGKSLKWVYENHRELFNNLTLDEFPLLTKIIDANDDLSVQVHPNDELAKNYGDLGKTECWYVIDCPKDCKLTYGHNAKSKNELKGLIVENHWNQLLKTIDIKPGDFIYVPAGKVHAISQGCLILETQQSSNITFRLYDYDRLDNQGKLRELNINESILATTVPDETVGIDIKTDKFGLNEITTYIHSKYFNVEKWIIKEPYSKLNNSFMLISILNGNGKVNTFDIQKGSHFIVTSQAKTININGNLEMIVSYIDI